MGEYVLHMEMHISKATEVLFTVAGNEQWGQAHVIEIPENVAKVEDVVCADRCWSIHALAA
jgi:hypothetical protein